MHASSDVVTSTPAFSLKNLIASGSSFFDGMPVFKSQYTLKVIKADINLYYSPNTITLETAGHSVLKLSSIGTGAIFSPPAVIINSLMRPVILMKPPSSIRPLSPVLK